MLSKTMPRLYSMGYFHGLRESRNFEAPKIMELMEKVGIEREDIDGFFEEYVKHMDKVSIQ